MLEKSGLMSVLQGLINDLAKEYGISAKFKVQGTPRRLSPDVEITLFRITQEAVNNIGKHARATESSLEIEFEPDKVRLRISDNGQGFDLPTVPADFGGSGKLGLGGMRERAKLINGTLAIRSGRGKGTTLVLEVFELTSGEQQSRIRH